LEGLARLSGGSLSLASPTLSVLCRSDQPRCFIAAMAVGRMQPETPPLAKSPTVDLVVRVPTAYFLSEETSAQEDEDAPPTAVK
jgi:hypothetical protein